MEPGIDTTVIEQIRHAMCCRKQKLSGRDRALLYIEYCVSKRGYKGPIADYYCVFCNSWHVGHRIPPEREQWYRKYMTIDRLLAFGFDEPCRCCALDQKPKPRQREDK